MKLSLDASASLRLVRLVQKIDVRESDLWMNAVYEGGPSLADEPIHLILGTQNMKGIRPKRRVDGKTAFIALHSTADEIEWPDLLDQSTGIYTYYGDNRTVGNGLFSSDGNKAIERIFSSDFDTQEGRLTIPPFFIFSAVDGFAARSVQFKGLAVPGCSGPQEDWCVSKFFRSTTGKFHNFQFKLTILAERSISKKWINDLINGEITSPNCPDWYQEWIEFGARTPCVIK